MPARILRAGTVLWGCTLSACWCFWAVWAGRSTWACRGRRIGPIFLFVTVMVYALIGYFGAHRQSEEILRRWAAHSPIYNGMAAAADWMSAGFLYQLGRGLVPARVWRHA